MKKICFKLLAAASISSSIVMGSIAGSTIQAHAAPQKPFNPFEPVPPVPANYEHPQGIPSGMINQATGDIHSTDPNRPDSQTPVTYHYWNPNGQPSNGRDYRPGVTPDETVNDGTDFPSQSYSGIR